MNQAPATRTEIYELVKKYQETKNKKYLQDLKFHHQDLIEKCQTAFGTSDEQVEHCIEVIASRFLINQGYAFSTILAYFLRSPEKVDDYSPRIEEL